MIRIVKLSGKYYGKVLDGYDFEDKLNEDASNIETFINEGNPVILAEDREDAAELLNINTSDIVLVD